MINHSQDSQASAFGIQHILLIIQLKYFPHQQALPQYLFRSDAKRHLLAEDSAGVWPEPVISLASAAAENLFL